MHWGYYSSYNSIRSPLLVSFCSPKDPVQSVAIKDVTKTSVYLSTGLVRQPDDRASVPESFPLTSMVSLPLTAGDRESHPDSRERYFTYLKFKFHV